MTWGLALGGGGPVGLTWEVGVLRALQDARSMVASTSDVIVGTSAGSMLGAWIRQGRSLEELESRTLSGAKLPGRALPLETEEDRLLYAQALRLWARPTSMTAAQAVQVGEVAAQVKRDDPGRLTSIEEEFGSRWPAARLIITTCRVRDGERCGWDRDDGESLHRVIAGSCTVPGQSAPIALGGDLHIDGGVWSSTNADLLGGAGVETVLALSPMAGAMGLGRAQEARLAAECDALSAIGVEAVPVTPGDTFRKARIDLLDAGRCRESLEMGREVGARLSIRIRELIGVKYST